MGLVKGNPVMLVVLFFGAAVLVMGSIYAVVPATIHEPTVMSVTILLALSLSLGFSLLIVGRIFWILTRSSERTPNSSVSRRSDD